MSASTETQAANVPMPPITALIGIAAPRMRMFNPNSPVGLSRPGSLIRRAITAACAVVNDSITPYE